MNQTTSKCGDWCYYYFNGQCTKPGGCASNYNKVSKVNATELGKPSHPTELSISKSIIPHKTIRINNCDCIYLTKRGIEVQFDLTALDFNDISQIIINGVKFNKE